MLRQYWVFIISMPANSLTSVRNFSSRYNAETLYLEEKLQIGELADILIVCSFLSLLGSDDGFCKIDVNIIGTYLTLMLKCF
jgi:hypothetical protein